MCTSHTKSQHSPHQRVSEPPSQSEASEAPAKKVSEKLSKPSEKAAVISSEIDNFGGPDPASFST